MANPQLPSWETLWQEQCRRSFIYFCNNFCHVLSGEQDASWIPFKLWAEQTKVAQSFQDERLIVILKARQLGQTWLAVAFGLWSMIFRPIATILLFSRRDDEAMELKARLAGMHAHLPKWLRQNVAKDNDHEIQFANGSRSLAFPTNAGDSYTGTLAIVDEADLIPDLSRLMRSVKPAIEGGGKLILLSRVDKFSPDSPFKRIYLGAREGKNGWTPIFLPWHARPGRDQKWYEETAAEVLHRTHSTDEMAEQYPASDEEALAPPNYGGRFKREWFRYYTPAGQLGWFSFGDKRYRLEHIGRRFLTVDPAASVKETAKADPDWTVISAWAQTECGLLVWLGCTRVRCEVPDIIPHVSMSYVRFRAGKAIIESGGTQKAVAQLARRHRLPNGAMMNIVEYNPKGRDKLDRAADMLDLASAGRLWLPQSDSTFPLAEVESELLRFTGDPKQGGKDDIFDSASIAGEEIAKGTGAVHNFTGAGTFGPVRRGFTFSNQ